MLNVRRTNLGPMDAGTAGSRGRPTRLDQLLGIDGARNQLADEQAFSGPIVNAASEPAAAGESSAEKV